MKNSSHPACFESEPVPRPHDRRRDHGSVDFCIIEHMMRQIGARLRNYNEFVSPMGNMTSSQSRSAQVSNHFPAFLFDFDGMLIDSVYQHVFAWQEAILKDGIELSVWRIHRRIGMSGGLLVNALSRETDRRLAEQEANQLQQWHAEAYLRQLEQVRPLPGARDLLACLTQLVTKWAIATSGRMQTASPNLACSAWCRM